MQYSGGKEKIAGKVVAVIRANLGGGEYYEPFLGGASIASRIGRGFASDSNPFLIAMWKALVAGWLPPESISEDVYRNIKLNKDRYPPELVAFAGFGCSYGGKWFGGYARNAAKGNYCGIARRSALKKAAGLSGVALSCADYDAANPQPGSLVYCDPPYRGTTIGYDKGRFDSDRFWAWAAEASRRSTVLVSEYVGGSGFVEVAAFPKRSTMSKQDYSMRCEKIFVHESRLAQVRSTGVAEAHHGGVHQQAAASPSSTREDAIATTTERAE